MGRWITIHGHHVYLKDPNEIDESLKGEQFKNTVKFNTELSYYPTKDEREVAKEVENDLAKYKKAFPDNTVERAYDAMYDYYPQLMPDDDSVHLIRNDEEGQQLIFAKINFGSSKDSDVWDKANIKVTTSHYDEFTDKELWDSFGIEREREEDNSEYGTFVKNGYDDTLANKPWTNAEKKRTEDISQQLFNKCYRTGDDNEFYEEDTVAEVEKLEFPQVTNFKESEITIHSNQLIYTKSWDENDRYVKKGGRVQGTTYYTVADNGDVIDENYMGYKTKEDARHAAMIYIRDKYGLGKPEPKQETPQSVSIMSPALKKVLNRKSKHFTSESNDQYTMYRNTQNKAWVKVYKNPTGPGYVTMHGNMLGDLANDLHGANGTAVRMYDTAELAHKNAQQYLIKMNRRGY